MDISSEMDTAVVFTSQEEKSKYDGKDNSGHYHFTNVWVKCDGKSRNSCQS
jgi:hypothetical protein